LGAASYEDRQVGKAGRVECRTGGGGDSLALGMGEVHGLAIGALCGEPGDAGLRQANCMRGNRFFIEVFRYWIEETDSRDVDPRYQWAGYVVVDVQ